MPRPRRLQPCPRSTTMALHVRHVSRASSSQAQAAATAAGTPATMLGALGMPRLSTGSANECRALASEKQPQRARQPGRRPGEGGRKRVFAGRRRVSYTHLRAHETKANLVCRLLLEKKT